MGYSLLLCVACRVSSAGRLTEGTSSVMWSPLVNRYRVPAALVNGEKTEELPGSRKNVG